MPIYEYRCRNGHEFEVFQSMTDEPVASCDQCGANVERIFRPVAVHFKGSGFYTTDYGRKASARSDGSGPEGSDSGDSAEKQGKGSEKKKSEAAKAGS
jgi:putative FmdB family regulatory protein